MVNPYPRAAIYVITHVPSGRQYIGSTRDTKQRWHQHRQKLETGQHVNSLMQRDWDADGANAFTFAVLETVPHISLLLEKERAAIGERHPYYNDSRSADAEAARRARYADYAPARIEPGWIPPSRVPPEVRKAAWDRTWRWLLSEPSPKDS